MDNDAFFNLSGSEHHESSHDALFESPLIFSDDSNRGDEITLDINHDHLHAAITAAAERAHYDASEDALTPSFVNDIQGITAEYLVADALNESHDGLQYRLFSDPTYPSVDIAGIDALGNVVRLIQVKATSSAWYANSALKPGLEVVTSADSWRDGLLRYDMTSEALRSIIESQLH